MLRLCGDENAKLLLEFLIDDDEDDEYQMDIANLFEDKTLFIAIAVSSWPHRLEKPILLSSSLPYGSANTFFINPDPQSLEKVTRLNPSTFHFLLSKYTKRWERSKEAPSKTRGSLSLRSLSAAASLGLVLHWLATGSSLTDLSLFSGVVLSTMSCHLSFALTCLYQTVISIKESMLEPPSDIYLKDIGEKMGREYGSVLRGCVMVTDGSIHSLERDDAANSNFFYQQNHPDYNGWKSVYCKKALYFFCMDGTIAWYAIDCPGSWHDGRIFERAYDFLYSLPQGCWVLGDSAFPKIPEKLERVRKAGEYLPHGGRGTFQLLLEQFCSKVRISAEWGIKDLKKSWRILSLPLPSDNSSKRRTI